jgi:uncharacterized protein YggT (Ycf19 family)
MTFDWGYFIYILCWVLTIIILLRAGVSWFPTKSRQPFRRLFYRIIEPILAPLH